MRFRIGVNLGDVIEQDDGTIYGDGVNIAARLESLAEPGGLTISGTTFDHVDGKLDLGFEYLGEKEVKNIAKPVRVYRADVGAGETRPAVAEAERPSIAVLAFENLSGDPEQEYFADGIAEDLITELSRLRWLLVTARNSTFTYKGQAVDVKQVGRDLGVRYVVEGSVRKAGARVRISAQLIDAVTGNHIWAERYDRALADTFALQDEITETLVAALQGEVGEVERERAHRRPPGSLDAWASYQRGMWHLWRMTADDLAEARRLFQHATDLDPNFAQAFAALGFTLFLEVVYSYAYSPLENVEQALRLANQAVTLDDKEAMAHFTLGRVQGMRGEYDAAIAELRTAIDLNPSLALAHMGLGLALMLTGRLDEAISEYDTAIRLSPRDPFVWVFYTLRAWARLLLGDYEAAVEDARRAIRHPMATFWPHAHLASALALLGRREEAKIALDKLLEIKPDFTVVDALAAHSLLNPEALRPRFKTWIEGLRKAGLDIPDEPASDD
jgi:TolB-like protein/Tfp pilus assembly protein PilF